MTGPADGRLARPFDTASGSAETWPWSGEVSGG
jgi:hypothetical protein